MESNQQQSESRNTVYSEPTREGHPEESRVCVDEQHYINELTKVLAPSSRFNTELSEVLSDAFHAALEHLQNPPGAEKVDTLEAGLQPETCGTEPLVREESVAVEPASTSVEDTTLPCEASMQETNGAQKDVCAWGTPFSNTSGRFSASEPFGTPVSAVSAMIHSALFRGPMVPHASRGAIHFASPSRHAGSLVKCSTGPDGARS